MKKTMNISWQDKMAFEADIDGHKIVIQIRKRQK